MDIISFHHKDGMFQFWMLGLNLFLDVTLDIPTSRYLPPKKKHSVIWRLGDEGSMQMSKLQLCSRFGLYFPY